MKTNTDSSLTTSSASTSSQGSIIKSYKIRKPFSLRQVPFKPVVPLNCKRADNVEVANDINMSHRCRNLYNTMSDGSGRDGVGCEVFKNRSGSVFLLKGSSVEAESVGLSRCLQTAQCAKREIVFHHLDCLSVQKLNFSAREKIIKMLRDALRVPVNLMHRIRHPTHKKKCPRYVRRFQQMDTCARATVNSLLAGCTIEIKLNPKMYIQLANAKQFSFVDFVLITRCHYEDVTVATLLEEDNLRAIIFKGVVQPKESITLKKHTWTNLLYF
jgi:hypothetical protein